MGNIADQLFVLLLMLNVLFCGFLQPQTHILVIAVEITDLTLGIRLQNIIKLPSLILRIATFSSLIGSNTPLWIHWVSIRLVKIRITMIATNISISRCLEISELTFVTINTLPGVPSRKVKSICFTYFSSSL